MNGLPDRLWIAVSHFRRHQRCRYVSDACDNTCVPPSCGASHNSVFHHDGIAPSPSYVPADEAQLNPTLSIRFRHQQLSSPFESLVLKNENDLLRSGNTTQVAQSWIGALGFSCGHS
jgi:hypothetical protein